MKADLIQSNFGAGELPDRAQGHVSSELYQSAVKRADNTIPTLEGTIASRAGGRLVPRVRADDNYFGDTGGATARVFGLKKSPLPGLAFETDFSSDNGLQHTRIMDSRGAVSLHEPFVLAPWKFTPPPGLAVSSRYDDGEKVIYLRGDTAESAQQALGVGPGGTTGEFTLEFEYSGSPVTVTVCDPTGVTIWYQRTFNPAVVADQVQSVKFTPAGTFVIRWSSANGTRIANMLLWKNGMVFELAAGAPGSSPWLPKFCETFWKGTSFYVVLWDGLTAPRGYVYTPPAVAGDRTNRVWNTWAIGFATFIPGAIVAFQSRLWLASSDGTGRVVATKAGYGAGAGSALALDFTYAAPPAVPKATDGLDLNLTGSRINWMHKLRGLMVGAEFEEVQFNQPNGGPLTVDPSAGLAFDVIDHSEYGSDATLPARGLGDAILFGLRGRRKFKLGSIQFASQGGFKAEDFSMLGEHLLHPRVKTFCVLRAPVTRAVFVMDDNTGAIATMGVKSTAWSRFTTGLGGLSWVTAVENDNGSELWAVSNLGGIIRFEGLDSVVPPAKTSWLPNFSTPNVTPDYNEVPVMDFWVRVPVAIDANGKPVPMKTLAYKNLWDMTGGQAGTLAHAIASEGNYLGSYDLGAASGLPGLTPPPCMVDMTTTYADDYGNVIPREVYIGIAYPQHRVVTLPQEGGNPAGSAQSYKSRAVQLYLRLIDSYMPNVGGEQATPFADDDRLDLLPTRYTGDVRVTQVKWSRARTIEIKQDQPLRFEISAIFGGTAVNSL